MVMMFTITKNSCSRLTMIFKCPFCKNKNIKDFDHPFCTDDPNTGYAYNLKICRMCDAIVKEDVWKNPGVIWISSTNEIVKIPKKTHLPELNVTNKRED